MTDQTIPCATIEYFHDDQPAPERRFVLSFDSDVDLYVVKVVHSADDEHDAGVVIPTAGGSRGVIGGPQPAGRRISAMLQMRDVRTALAALLGTDYDKVPDGTVVVKCFGRSAVSGLWSK